MLKNSKKEAKPQSKPKKHDFEKGKKSVTLNSYPATTSNFTPSLKKDSQYFQNLVSIYKSDSTKYQEYKLFWYFDKLYAIDDCVMVDIYDDESVGKITRIMRVETEELFLLLIEVQWYYRKRDLPKLYKEYIKFIGDNEVFLPANYNRDIIEIQNIEGFCEVITQEKYEKLSSIPSNVFFYRAKYDNFNKKLIPEPEKWPKYCLCESPYCPDLAYIQCDICDKWFHYKCVNLMEEECIELEKYICLLCQSKKNF